jgi:glycosyltransferase involved in cell wall biosynthesis
MTKPEDLAVILNFRGIALKNEAIILSAHHCAPGMGSEHAVGWNYLRELSASHQIILISEDNGFRRAIEAEVAKLNASGASIETFFVHHGATTDGRKNNLRIFYYLTYTVYQWRVYKLAKRLCSERNIAAVHHLTIVGFREPGFLWLLDKPFIWGPVGGLVYSPMELLGLLSPKMRVFQIIRNAVTGLQFYSSVRVRLAYAAATRRSGGCFIAATQDIGKRFVKRFGGTFVHVPETGSYESSLLKKQPRGDESILTLLWVGALIDIKPLALLLQSIAKVNGHKDKIFLDVIGDGDSAARFKSRADELRVNARFHGWVDYKKVHDMYASSDLFVLLSMKDLTTNVVFEALSNGVPVLCLDHHGYSEIVTDECGYKVPVAHPREISHGIAKILTDLCENKAPLERKSTAATKRAMMFSWGRNADALRHIYDIAIGSHSRKP